MKNKFLHVLGLTLIAGTLCSQAISLPYTTGFDNATDKAGWMEYKKAGTLTGGWDYTSSASNAYSQPQALWQIYSTSENVDNWFVSPSFSIPSGGVLDSIRYRFNGFSEPALSDTVAIYLLRGSQNPSSATKVLLKDFRGAEYVNDGIYKKKSNISLPGAAGLSFLAIRFKCTAGTWLETYFDNISIKANPVNTTGFKQAGGSSQEIQVFPNPASESITVELAQETMHSFYIFNAVGLLVREAEVRGTTQLNISELPEGVYYVRIKELPSFSQKIIKQ